ncbi:TonB-dependent receptor [bacterium]
MKYKFTQLIFTFTFFLSGFALFARDTLTYHFPRITITANRYEKDSFETHLQSNSLNGSQAWQQGKTNFGDLIESIPGISQIQVGPWSQKSVIRGLSEAHVLTLVDGMKLDVLRDYGNHAPLIDIDQIERIEVIRGPGSVLYGSNAVAGVVNIITKSPQSISQSYAVKSHIGFQYASVNRQFSEILTLTGKYNKYDLLLNISHRRAEDVNTPSGKLKNTSFSGYTSDLKLGFHPGKNHHLQISGHLTRMDNVGVPINPFAQTAHFKAYNRDRISFHYKWHPADHLLSHISTELYFQQGEREFDAFLYHIPKGPLFVNNHLTAHRDVRTYGGSLQTGWNVSDRNLLIAGIDLFAEQDDTRRISDPEVVDAHDLIKMDPPADLTPPTPLSHREGMAIFLEDEWHLSALMSLNTGFRVDRIYSKAAGTPGTLTEKDRNESDGDFSASIGAVIRLSEQMRLTANIGRAFKAPTLQERYFKGAAQIGYLEGNPNLNSETSLNLDVGIRVKTDYLETSLNVFQNQIENFIVMKPVVLTADTFLYDNVGQAELYGAEWDGQFKFTDLWTIFANVAYVHGEDKELNENLPKIPPFNGLIGLKLGNELQGSWITISAQLCAQQNLVAPNELKTDAYQLIHLSSGFKLNQLLKVKAPLYWTVNIHNLLNTSYRNHLSHVTWSDAPGRNIIFGIRGNF